ncbi:hypothetical protein [Pseudomonas gingeri]|uniref:hypothetical protein n=1 Tax=Pseudomonas gingeri TaxID=117681 RepID=UPI0015A18B23|nr:hypothetical protein [Pseudomonas gingeri]NWE45312.1 hypothetical protein [Pseudomonas gingeri]
MGELLDFIFSRSSAFAIFKAGIVLWGVSLLGMSQIGPFLYDKDIDAHADRYKIEWLSGKKLEDTDCNALALNNAECRLAKHKARTLDSGLSLWNSIINNSMIIGKAFVGFSGLIFVLAPFFRDYERNIGV